jgi:hypothetical protein
MNIYPKASLTIDCPECGLESTFLCNDLADKSIEMKWACGHRLGNNDELYSLAVFYNHKIFEASQELKNNKENLEQAMLIKLPAKISNTYS